MTKLFSIPDDKRAGGQLEQLKAQLSSLGDVVDLFLVLLALLALFVRLFL
jgi:hypothetical protein